MGDKSMKDTAQEVEIGDEDTKVEEAEVEAPVDQKVAHLMEIIAQAALGNRIIDKPANDGGIALAANENDILGMAVDIWDIIIPDYYGGNGKAFLTDALIVMHNALAKDDDGEPIGSGDPLADFDEWLERIVDDVDAGKTWSGLSIEAA
jgi:hypothetical protein